MTRLKIALLAGGDSPEREIALQSAAQIEAAIRKYAITFGVGPAGTGKTYLAVAIWRRC